MRVGAVTKIMKIFSSGSNDAGLVVTMLTMLKSREEEDEDEEAESPGAEDSQ